MTKKSFLKVVRYEEFFATEAEFKKRDSFINYLKEGENKSRLAKIAKVNEDDIIITEKPLKVKMFDKINDPIAIFNGKNIMYNSILNCEECLLNLIIDKNLYIQRVFTFDDEKRDSIKAAMDKMSKGFVKTGN